MVSIGHKLAQLIVYSFVIQMSSCVYLHYKYMEINVCLCSFTITNIDENDR